MFAIIHQPAPNSMQSGNHGSEMWEIEFPRDSKVSIDPLTGNINSTDMMSEVQLKFDSKDAAIAYAKLKGIAYRVLPSRQHIPKGRSYGENFAYARKFPWTH